MAQRPSRVERAAGVASVGRRYGISGLKRPIHRPQDQRSREAAIADALILAVPSAFLRKPNLKPDLRLVRRLDFSLHSAERRMERHWRRRIEPHDARRRGHVGRRHYPGVAIGLAGKVAAIGGCRCLGCKSKSSDGGRRAGYSDARTPSCLPTGWFPHDLPPSFSFRRLRACIWPAISSPNNRRFSPFPPEKASPTSPSFDCARVRSPRRLRRFTSSRNARARHTARRRTQGFAFRAMRAA